MMETALTEARTSKSRMLAGMMNFPPVDVAEAYRQQEILVWGLEQMEGETRFMMPATRAYLDEMTDVFIVSEISDEVTALIERLRGPTPFLADFRATRLALFRLNPNRATLRKIWIRNP
jgi:hypothetical protein